jgi:hypothetical protein
VCVDIAEEDGDGIIWQIRSSKPVPNFQGFSLIAWMKTNKYASYVLILGAKAISFISAFPRFVFPSLISFFLNDSKPLFKYCALHFTEKVKGNG